MNAILYSSTDTGAPVLSRTVGSLNALLKACLVNGYGSQPSCGWTNPFNDAPNNVSVFRMAGGTQMYIQITDNGGNCYQYGAASVQAYKSMSSAYLGLEATPQLGSILPNTSAFPFIPKELSSQSVSLSTAVPWYLLADDKGFWFIPYLWNNTIGSYPYMGACSAPAYIGDYIPFDITNTFNFCMITPANTNGGTFASLFSSSGTNGTNTMGGCYVLRDIGFAIGSTTCGIWNPFYNNNFIGQGSGGTVTNTNGFGPYQGRLIGVSCYITTINGGIMGVVPSIQSTLFRYPSAYNVQASDNAASIITDGINSQLVIPTVQQGQRGNPGGNCWGKVLFNLGNRFRYVY